jgi:2-octaprenylphenol hydroxylase
MRGLDYLARWRCDRESGVSLKFDIVVVGGGLAGACAAALLARHAGVAPQRVALLSDELPAMPSADAPAELRVVAISRASERVLRAAAAWQHLDAARLCAYESVRVWHESVAPLAQGALHFDAADVGEANLGYIAENGALARACHDSFIAAGGTRINAVVQGLHFDSDQATLRTADGRDIAAQLVVGADGAQSLVRARSGGVSRTLDYRQLAIVATVRTAKPHQHTAWQRFLHTGPLALLPLFNAQSSIVWSMDLSAAQALRDMSDAQFNERLLAATDGVLGDVALVSQRLTFPLRSMAAHSYVAARCALIGDAAHVIHPLAGQGANLGLLDAAALCEAVAGAVAQHEDVGALRILRRYEQQRRTHNLLMDAAMSAFRTGFAATVGPGAWLVNRVLGGVNRSAMLKRAFARHALGTSGELPRFARAVVR